MVVVSESMSVKMSYRRLHWSANTGLEKAQCTTKYFSNTVHIYILFIDVSFLIQIVQGVLQHPQHPYFLWLWLQHPSVCVISLRTGMQVQSQC